MFLVTKLHPTPPIYDHKVKKIKDFFQNLIQITELYYSLIDCINLNYMNNYHFNNRIIIIMKAVALKKELTASKLQDTEFLVNILYLS